MRRGSLSGAQQALVALQRGRELPASLFFSALTRFPASRTAVANPLVALSGVLQQACLPVASLLCPPRAVPANDEVASAPAPASE